LTIDLDGTHWEDREGRVHCGDAPFQHVFHLRIPVTSRDGIKRLLRRAHEL
jgi:hypothetical protein